MILVFKLKDVSCCYYCKSTNFAKWGSSATYPRFMCKDCKKTFNVFTGTPFARLKMKEKIFTYLSEIQGSLSLRKMAKELDVSLSTAIRWRNALSDVVVEVPPEHAKKD